MILDYPLTACLQQVGVGLYQKNNQFLIHIWMKMKSFHDYLGLSNSCSYDIIGRADRFGFQNFCSPGLVTIATRTFKSIPYTSLLWNYQAIQVWHFQLLWQHSYDVIPLLQWHAVYAMLLSFSSCIPVLNLKSQTLKFSQTNNFSQIN